METLSFIQTFGFLHWITALLGIICFVFVRLYKVKEFSFHRWINENIIGVIWSLFWISLVVGLTVDYYSHYSLLDSFLTGYVGTHVIFRLEKETAKSFSENKKYNHHRIEEPTLRHPKPHGKSPSRLTKSPRRR